MTIGGGVVETAQAPSECRRVHQSDGHGVAMTPAVVLGALDRVPERVSVVENLAAALLGEVRTDNLGLHPDRPLEEVRFDGVARLAYAGAIALDQLQDHRVGDESA